MLKLYVALCLILVAILHLSRGLPPSDGGSYGCNCGVLTYGDARYSMLFFSAVMLPNACRLMLVSLRRARPCLSYGDILLDLWAILKNTSFNLTVEEILFGAVAVILLGYHFGHRVYP